MIFAGHSFPFFIKAAGFIWHIHFCTIHFCTIWGSAFLQGNWNQLLTYREERRKRSWKLNFSSQRYPFGDKDGFDNDIYCLFVIITIASFSFPGHLQGLVALFLWRESAFKLHLANSNDFFPLHKSKPLWLHSQCSWMITYASIFRRWRRR